jgi:hypothetical protein
VDLLLLAGPPDHADVDRRGRLQDQLVCTPRSEPVEQRGDRLSKKNYLLCDF